MGATAEAIGAAMSRDAARFLERYNPMTYEEVLEIALRRDARDIPRLVQAVVRLKDCYREAGAALGWPMHPADQGADAYGAMLALHA